MKNTNSGKKDLDSPGACCPVKHTKKIPAKPAAVLQPSAFVLRSLTEKNIVSCSLVNMLLLLLIKI